MIIVASYFSKSSAFKMFSVHFKVLHSMAPNYLRHLISVLPPSRYNLRTFARKFSNIDFFLRILPLKVDELVMSEM